MQPPITDIPLEAKVAFLRHANHYPGANLRVEAIETHMSWVFLTDRLAYKLKKPVYFDPMDARSVSQRHYYCSEEVRLNRRLAPQVYLAVIPLSVDRRGHLHLSGDGIVCDWLVMMRRLPATRMLDYKLCSGQDVTADIEQIAAVVAAYHRHCQRIPLSAAQFRSRLATQIDHHRHFLRSPLYQVPLPRLDRLCDAQEAALSEFGPLLDKRVQDGHIIEGHGDMRAEHVYLGDPPAIIDCIEFSLDLRTIDNLDDIAFLALECERLGGLEYAQLLLRRYITLSGDPAPPRLVRFYTSVRATTRAYITLRHLDEDKFRFSSEWTKRASTYLQIAEHNLDR